nr:hypothetical protein CFP56_63074 [Quercus suber]
MGFEGTFRQASGEGDGSIHQLRHIDLSSRRSISRSSCIAQDDVPSQTRNRRASQSSSSFGPETQLNHHLSLSSFQVALVGPSPNVEHGASE